MINSRGVSGVKPPFSAQTHAYYVVLLLRVLTDLGCCDRCSSLGRGARGKAHTGAIPIPTGLGHADRRTSSCTSGVGRPYAGRSLLGAPTASPRSTLSPSPSFQIDNPLQIVGWGENGASGVVIIENIPQIVKAANSWGKRGWCEWRGRGSRSLQKKKSKRHAKKTLRLSWDTGAGLVIWCGLGCCVRRITKRQKKKN